MFNSYVLTVSIYVISVAPMTLYMSPYEVPIAVLRKDKSRIFNESMEKNFFVMNDFFVARSKVLVHWSTGLRICLSSSVSMTSKTQP